MNWNNLFSLRLREAPLPLRALALGYVLSLALGYLYALVNIGIVVGLSPEKIAIHYYGAPKAIVEKAPESLGEESFSIEEMESMEQKPALGPRPSFKNLVAEGHFHLFGMSSFFFGLGLLGLFVGVGDRFKAALILGSFVGIILDNMSFMATRFLGPGFAYLTAISGSLMGTCFFILWGLILRELILSLKEGR